MRKSILILACLVIGCASSDNNTGTAQSAIGIDGGPSDSGYGYDVRTERNIGGNDSGSGGITETGGTTETGGNEGGIGGAGGSGGTGGIAGAGGTGGSGGTGGTGGCNTGDDECWGECAQDELNGHPEVLDAARRGFRRGIAKCPGGGVPFCPAPPAVPNIPPAEEVCVWASARASVSVCAWAWAWSCVQCPNNGPTICAFADAWACASAYAEAYAYACAGAK